jgi:capsular exopolysaccharide synthesis family protein
MPEPVAGAAATALVPSPAARALVPATLTAKPNFLSLLLALRRRWLLALSLGVVCATVAGAAAVYFLPPAKYTVRTLMRLPAGSYLGRPEAGGNPTDQRTHVALIRSRWVLSSVLKEPKVAALGIVKAEAEPNPIEWLEKEVQADFSIAPDILKISMSGDNAGELTTLVDELRKAYIREVLDKENLDRNKKVEWLHKQREHYEELLRRSKKDQQDNEQSALKDASSRSMYLGFVQQQLNWAERDLMQTQSELGRLQAELAVYQPKEKRDLPALGASTAGLLGSPLGQGPILAASALFPRSTETRPAKTPVPPAIVEELLSQDSEYQAAQAKIRELQKVIADTTRVAVQPERNPRLQQTLQGYRQQLKGAEESLTLLHGKLAPFYEEEVRKKKDQETASSTAILQVRISTNVEYEKKLLSLIDRLRERFQEVSRNIVRLDAIQEDMSLYEKMAEQMKREEETLRLEVQAPERFTVIEPAVATKMSDGKRLLLAGGGAAGGALALVCLAVGLWEFRARRVSTADEVVHGLGMKLVGTIPNVAPRYPRRRGAGEDGADNLLSEAVDTTRTILLRAAKAEGLRSVMVTSAQSGEGKTSLATHLAASLAQIGHQTLLIDGDLRNPIAHQVFGVDPEPGLCDLLRGEATLDEIIRPTPIGHLAMIAAGRWDSRATRALAQEGTGHLLRGLRERFEFIIIDTSPVLPVVDALLIGQHVDGVVLSVLRDVSRMPNVYAAHQRLSAAGVRVLGAVVSGVHSEHYGAYAYPYQSAAGPEG